MTENFGGALNLIVWIVLMLGAAYYGFRCLFQTKAFNDQYGNGDAATYMTRFAGSGIFALAIVMLVLVFMGPSGQWGVAVLGWLYMLIGTVMGYSTVNSEWSQVEGVKATAEGYIAPGIFCVLWTILLYNMSSILY